MVELAASSSDDSHVKAPLPFIRALKPDAGLQDGETRREKTSNQKTEKEGEIPDIEQTKHGANVSG